MSPPLPGQAQQARSYVLIGESTGSRDDFSAGFRSYVLEHAVKGLDRVVIAVPSLAEIERTSAIWSDWTGFEIHQVSLTSGESREAEHEYFSTAGHPSAPALFTRDPQLLRRYLPTGTATIVRVPVLSLSAFMDQVADQAAIALVAVGASVECAAWIAQARSSDFQFEQLSLDIHDAERELVSAIDNVLAAHGYARAGRAWGAAGTSRLYSRPTGIRSRFTASKQEGRVALGRVVQGLRSSIPARRDLQAARDRVKVALDPRFTRADVLDPDHGIPETQIRALDVDRLARRYEEREKRQFTVTVSDEDSVVEVANECFNRHGVWPISFSYPRPWPDHGNPPSEDLSPIIPGFPYSFVDHDEYMRCYNAASLAITHRKAGWDCFRHVEILASGSVPLMIDAADIPPYTMIHYPKRALGLVAHRVLNEGGVPDAVTRGEFQRFFQEHLTTRSMANYMLSVTGLPDAESVLFVDQQHPGISDYQSTLALIGLKEIYGSACRPLYPAPWIYEDWEGETSHLYGRGFGYTRVLPVEARSDAESACLAAAARTTVSDGEPDLIVVGSVSRNLSQAKDLLLQYPPARTIWIHGEDTPPLITDARMLRQSGAHVLVRSIGSRRRRSSS